MAPRQEQYVLDCLRRNELTFRGSYVPRFEAAVADFLGQPHCVSTCNGSVSLFALYRALFAGGGKRLVAAPTMTYAATVSQLVLAGFTPVYYDCKDDFQADELGLELTLKKFRGELAGAVVAPLYGGAPDMPRVRWACDKWDLPLVVDAAEAFGCEQGGRAVGAYGEAASYSFFANKIVTTGEGGCVTTDDASLADRVRLFCNQSTRGGYKHEGPGTNFRMTNLQAAVGCAQLEVVEDILRRKRAIASFYRERIKFPPVTPIGVDCSSEWMILFRLGGPRYEAFRRHCESHGVEVRPCFYPLMCLPSDIGRRHYPLHTMPGFEGQFPFWAGKAEELADAHFIVPCHPSLRDEDLARVAAVVNSFEDVA